MTQLNTLFQQLDQMRSLLLSYPKETIRDLYKKVLQSGLIRISFLLRGCQSTDAFSIISRRTLSY